ncbi:MAG: carbohydrate kinase [Clostridiales bacterium]|jgi:sugar/nucleoside kinase (ribokinase family)|nr:PfkB family carbohydrate kinase [Bacillota bacterium]NLL55391.1 carbohydrate kinase [Clostridiales bacterium]
MKLIALGDNCIDYYRNTGEAFAGGNAVNVAVNAAEFGADAEYMGSMGSDDMTRIICNALDSRGIRRDRSPFLPGRTTKVCRYDLIDGERRYIDVVIGETWAGPPTLNAAQMEGLALADIVVSSCNAKMPECLAVVEQLPPVFAYDFGEKEKYRTAEYYDVVCHGIDLAMFSCTGMDKSEFRDFCAPLHRRGIVHVLATMGCAGQFISNGSEIVHCLPEPVDAIDTMGAGDAFLAGFVCRLWLSGWRKGCPMAGKTLYRALKAGAQQAAKNCLREGGFGYKVELPTVNKQ